MRISRTRRLAIPLILLAGAAFALSAKCIENDSLRIGRDGNWHLYGEIHNETDVQGLDIRLQGTAFDANGAQVASAQATMCPSSLSPGTFSVYDVELSVPSGGQQPASHKVNVSGGTASDQRLPSLAGGFSDLRLYMAKKPTTGIAASHEGTFKLTTPISDAPISRGDPNLPNFMYCIAGYDDQGDLVEVLPPRPARVASTGTVAMKSSPGSLDVFSNLVPEPVSRDVVSFRFLLWQVADNGTPLTAVTISAVFPSFRPGPGDDGEF